MKDLYGITYLSAPYACGQQGIVRNADTGVYVATNIQHLLKHINVITGVGTDVWAVGERGLVLSGIGGFPTVVSAGSLVGVTDTFNDISGTVDDILVVGDNGQAHSWQGAVWAALAGGPATDLLGCEYLDANSFIVVGERGACYHVVPSTDTWTDINALGALGTYRVEKVAKYSTSIAYVVGENGLIARCEDDGGWEIAYVWSGGVHTTSPLKDIYGVSGEFFICGYDGFAYQMTHDTTPGNEVFADLEPKANLDFTSVKAVDPGDVYFCALGGAIARYDSTIGWSRLMGWNTSVRA